MRRYAALIIVVLAGCGGERYASLQGQIMGTTFTMQAACADGAQALARAEAMLVQVDAQMSTYKPDSQLMQLNRAAAGERVRVGRDVVAVLTLAEALHEQSGGAFNVALGHLVDAWGFGTSRPTEVAPSDEEITRLLPASVGFVLEGADRAARVQDVSINLSAIAKGYGVDQAASALAETCGDFMVDVGGEVRAQGKSPRGDAWRVGIETPEAGRRGIAEVLYLDDLAVATSGDYRNYREVAGKRISHTLDGRTGRPISHNLASVTVVHVACSAADGYATVLNVLGPDAGWQFAETHNLAALFIERTDDGFETRYTGAMAKYLQSPGE